MTDTTTPQVYSAKQAADYLGIAHITLKRYVADENVPLTGTLLTPRNRIFTQTELDSFKQYMQDNNLGKAGRPADPDAPYHGWRQGRRQNAPVIKTQRVADGIKALVLAKKPSPDRRRAAMDAIQAFEVLAFIPAAFDENCPSFDVAADGAVTFTGSGKLIDAVIDELAAYAQAVQ